MHYIRKHLPIHLFVSHPISAVQVWHVKVITLISPAFVEYLSELFFGFEIHAKVHVQASRAGLWRRAISINNKERWRWWTSSSRGGPSSTTATTGGTIDQLVAVGAHFIGQNSIDESRCAPVTEPVPNQFITAAQAKTATTTASPRGPGLQV